jgi:succinylarginine dihydrolase
MAIGARLGSMREYDFDGLVGPTHNYAGLSPGNVASEKHGGQVSNPRAAALQGLDKMKFVHALGVGQAVLPPHPRPHLPTLRRLGFHGSDEEILARAAREQSGHLLRLCSSASAMWTANAATVAPSADTEDRRLHLTAANLQQMFHRSIEGEQTWRVLAAIFADERRFAVHPPLPGGGQLADEGAANHTRLVVPGRKAVHLFGWSRRSFARAESLPGQYPARQTFEASQALARLHRLDPARVLLVQQHPEGIDGGAFHTDVVAVGNESFLMLHELAFVDLTSLISQLDELLGEELSVEIATEAELPLGDAVSAYPFNSQVLTLPNGRMTIVAPVESRENEHARRFLERIVDSPNPVESVHYLDVRQSMNNGGGPACLRLRVAMTAEEVAAVRANVFFGDALHAELLAWVERHYRDRLSAADLADPALQREGMAALDELSGILRLGSVYDFQRLGPARK